MTSRKTSSSRREFLARGTVTLGAGVAATGTTILPAQTENASDGELQQLRKQLAMARDREAIRRLHLDLLSLLAQQRFGAVAALFDADAELRLGELCACGRVEIERQLVAHHAGQHAFEVHTGFRPTHAQCRDQVDVAAPGDQASASFQVEAEVCMLLQGDTTVVAMAKQQGNVATRSWEPGLLEGRYVKRAGEWKISALHYRRA